MPFWIALALLIGILVGIQIERARRYWQSLPRRHEPVKYSAYGREKDDIK